MTTKMKPFTEEAASICTKEAEKYGVISSIHPEDLIFQFCFNNSCFDTDERAIHYYFKQSNDSAEKLQDLIDRFYQGSSDEIKLLEFASGYGAVTRHLLNSESNYKLTACDIHEQAIDFLRNTIGVKAEISHANPDSLDLSETYDVVFALSFFSHMPKSTWGKWLDSLARNVKNNGLLIFTAHGAVTRKKFNDPVVDEDGFWFKPSSEQFDLDGNEYGMTVTLKEFVDKEIDKIDGFSLKYYEEAYWWGHQDVYVLEKSS